MIKKSPLLILMTLALVTLSAAGADLTQAKRDGLAGERADGYLGLVVESAPAEVKALIMDINAKRKVEYQRIAQKNGISVEQVQALAGKKAIERTADGNWILVNDHWERK